MKGPDKSASFNQHKDALFKNFYDEIGAMLQGKKEGEPVSVGFKMDISAIPPKEYGVLFDAFKAARSELGFVPLKPAVPKGWMYSEQPRGADNTRNVMDFDRDKKGLMIVNIIEADWDKMQVDGSLKDKVNKSVEAKLSPTLTTKMPVASAVQPEVVGEPTWSSRFTPSPEQSPRNSEGEKKGLTRSESMEKLKRSITPGELRQTPSPRDPGHSTGQGRIM